MKNISLILVALAIAYFNVSCDRTYKGKADIKGVLMYKCGSNDPMGNVTVSLTAGATLLSATTDANGYFHINGPYEYTTRKEISQRLEITSHGQNGGGFGSIILLEDAPDTFNDTIYFFNSTYAILTIDTDKSSFGNNSDTLIVRYSDMDAPHGGEERILKFAGPFYNGRVLDTIHMILEPHVGYGGSALGTSPCTVFFNGQPFQNTRPVFIEGQPNDACGNYYDSYIQLDLLN